LAEVPKDKKLVLICNTGVRSYEAQITQTGDGDSDSRISHDEDEQEPMHPARFFAVCPYS